MKHFSSSKTYIPTRRFGRTEINMPLLSVGGMRFQQSWEDIQSSCIEQNSQTNLEQILRKTMQHGLHHIETARHYGSSESQLGKAFKHINDSNRILQTKIPPNKDSDEFEANLKISFQRLKCNRVDLLAIHGINLPEHLEQTLCKGGCLEVARKWQREGKVGAIGFSTHGSTELIIKAIESDCFDYVNLHWYFIRQDNELALKIASKHDLGVFIISPTDKGGHLHTPSAKLLDLCKPLHPIVFNDLFCLRDTRVHTISVGLSRISDLDLHLKAIDLMKSDNLLVENIISRLRSAEDLALGAEWMKTWHVGLPNWSDTPGEINIPILLWLHNLIEAWEMEGFARDRYSLLGKAGHWFPGANADSIDAEVSEEALKSVLSGSPWIDQIPDILRALKMRFVGQSRKRLWTP